MLAVAQTLPSMLNGSPVEQIVNHWNGYHTVLVKRGANDFVVATWWPELKTSWSWGHYETAYSDALRVFDEVSGRNSSRGRV